MNRVNDYALMEEVITSDLHNDDIRSINLCWIYLHVQNLSDIVNGAGDNISDSARNHIRDVHRKTSYRWPN